MAVALAEMAERYPELPPVYITEGGASFEDLEIHDAEGRLIVPDERRVRYLAEHIGAAIEATSPGGAAESIDLRGYYVWSLMDNFEWSAGYKQQFGLLHVDRETMVRTPKASYYWIRELMAARNRGAAVDAETPTAGAGTGAGTAGAEGHRGRNPGRGLAGELEDLQLLQALGHAGAVGRVDPGDRGTGVVAVLGVAAGQHCLAGGELADADGGHPVTVGLGELRIDGLVVLAVVAKEEPAHVRGTPWRAVPGSGACGPGRCGTSGRG